MIIFKKSKASHNKTNYYISLINYTRYLCIVGSHDGFDGKYLDEVFIAPLTAKNANKVRKIFPWLNPKPLSMNTSFGFGDRLGYATCGHISAIEKTSIYPVFAQQSVRENQRTGRTPQQVIDDAMWQVFQSGYHGVWGADADHIKEKEDFAPFIKAGFTFYTIDPSDYVNNFVNQYSISELISFVNDQSFINEYLSLDIPLDLDITEKKVLMAKVKYGKAIEYAKEMSLYLQQNLSHFDLEISVDETALATTPFEHFFIVRELRKNNVPFVSVAPRFVGSFEKGVDYIGDLKEFSSHLKKHVRVMDYIGGYKLSIHTGSDKFSIYDELSLRANNKIHVKTAGTSYLEALKVIAKVDKEFFAEIYDFCQKQYMTDKVTYHVSAQLSKLPKVDDYIELFSNFDARQVLHVTFGSVLDKYKDRFNKVLLTNMDLYNSYLKEHFTKHLLPFIKK
ncbi:MAG: hypothetical protein KAG94_01585 [Clostridiales bacterium]|nr:hypothetical protein [Clostridiales bacterium]